jgi:hypothetical protein
VRIVIEPRGHRQPSATCRLHPGRRFSDTLGHDVVLLATMLTLTVTAATLKALSINQELMKSSPLARSAVQALTPLLMARGFDVVKPIDVSERSEGGFTLTQ